MVKVVLIAVSFLEGVGLYVPDYTCLQYVRKYIAYNCHVVSGWASSTNQAAVIN